MGCLERSCVPWTPRKGVELVERKEGGGRRVLSDRREREQAGATVSTGQDEGSGESRGMCV